MGTNAQPAVPILLTPLKRSRCVRPRSAHQQSSEHRPRRGNPSRGETPLGDALTIDGRALLLRRLFRLPRLTSWWGRSSLPTLTPRRRRGNESHSSAACAKFPNRNHNLLPRYLPLESLVIGHSVAPAPLRQSSHTSHPTGKAIGEDSTKRFNRRIRRTAACGDLDVVASTRRSARSAEE